MAGSSATTAAAMYLLTKTTISAIIIHMNEPDAFSDGTPEKGLWDINPEVPHNPDATAQDNFSRAYDGSPPAGVIALGAFLDSTKELHARLDSGDITEDEFMELYIGMADNTGDFMDGEKLD